MPDDNLAAHTKKVLRASRDFIGNQTPDKNTRTNILGDLAEVERVLYGDLQERKVYPQEIDSECRKEIGALEARFNERDTVQRHLNKQHAILTRFEHLRQINNGGYPKNVNPILYWIPLFLVAVSEWYVNYSSFVARFVPAVAIACTIIVGLLFAYTSHLLGAYLKQWSEISNPAIERRAVIDRKVAVISLTIVLLIVFLATMWLRYTIVKDQLGLSVNEQNCVFCTETTGRIWSTLLPTIAINIGIIAIGTAYSWYMHEKIPDLRETHRLLEKTQRKFDRLKAPLESEIKQLAAACDRNKKLNKGLSSEYISLLREVKEVKGRINDNAA